MRATQRLAGVEKAYVAWFDTLREHLSYDPETGAFAWLRPGRRRKVGSRAGCVTKRGYRVVRVEGRAVQEHRLAYAFVNGAFPAGEIDHINGVKDDNRIANLREVTHAVNMENLQSARSDNKSGFLGVAFYPAKFRAQIRSAGKTYAGPYRDRAEDAYQDYLLLKRKHHEGCML